MNIDKNIKIEKKFLEKNLGVEKIKQIFLPFMGENREKFLNSSEHDIIQFYLQWYKQNVAEHIDMELPTIEN
jgi:hypothetical protein